MISARFKLKSGETRAQTFHDYEALGIWVKEHHAEIDEIWTIRVKSYTLRQGRDN